MQLHSGMYFRNEESVSSLATRAVGSVNVDSQVTFEFAVRPEFHKKLQSQKEGTTATEASPKASTDAPVAGEAEAVSAVPAPPVPLPTSLPFQMQIRYTKPNGSKCLRVVTKTKPVTTDRSQAERNARIGLLATHCQQHTAYMAQRGDYEGARVKSYAMRNMMGRVATNSDGAAPV